MPGTEPTKITASPTPGLSDCQSRRLMSSNPQTAVLQDHQAVSQVKQTATRWPSQHRFGWRMQVAHHGSAQPGTGDQSRCSQLNFSGKTLAQCWRTDAHHRDGSETQATARCFVFSFLNHQDHSFDAALEALCHAPPITCILSTEPRTNVKFTQALSRSTHTFSDRLRPACAIAMSVRGKPTFARKTGEALRGIARLSCRKPLWKRAS